MRKLASMNSEDLNEGNALGHLGNYLRMANENGYDGKTGFEAVKALVADLNKDGKSFVQVTPDRNHPGMVKVSLGFADGLASANLALDRR